MAIEREVYVKDEANHGDSDCDHFHDAVHDAVGRNGNDSSNALEESDHVFYARNFERAVLQQQKNPGSPLLKVCCGIGEAFGDLPHSSLIHPFSIFSIGWTVATAILLLYTAIVTPPVISFYWNSEPCQYPPTIYADVIVDSFFLLDIILVFCTGIIINGKYHDKFTTVAKNYLTHGLWFDVLTSIPVSFVEVYMSSLCASAGDPQSSSGSSDTADSELKLIRILKPLRWFKLARVLKMSKLKDIGVKIGDAFGVPPRVVRLLLVLNGMIMGVHLFASFFWFVKVLSNEQEELDAFLIKQFLEPEMQYEAQGYVQIYVLCFYFIVTTWTSVGYGDVSASNTIERAYIILAQLIGTVVFATLLSEVQDMQQMAQRVALAKGRLVSMAMDYLQEKDVPDTLQREIVNWIRFSFEQKQSSHDKQTIIHDLPPTLQGRLIQFLNAPALVKVSIIGLIDSIESTFMVQICQYIKFDEICKGATLIFMHEPADRLLLIAEGVCSLEVETDDIYAQVAQKYLHKGMFVGEYSLTGETDWGGSSYINKPGKSIELVANTYMVITTLSAQNFRKVVHEMPSKVSRQISSYAQNRLQQLQEGEILESDVMMERFGVKWTRISRMVLVRWRAAHSDGLDPLHFDRFKMLCQRKKKLTDTIERPTGIKPQEHISHFSSNVKQQHEIPHLVPPIHQQFPNLTPIQQQKHAEHCTVIHHHHYHGNSVAMVENSDAIKKNLETMVEGIQIKSEANETLRLINGFLALNKDQLAPYLDRIDAKLVSLYYEGTREAHTGGKTKENLAGGAHCIETSLASSLSVHPPPPAGPNARKYFVEPTPNWTRLINGKNVSVHASLVQDERITSVQRTSLTVRPPPPLPNATGGLMVRDDWLKEEQPQRQVSGAHELGHSLEPIKHVTSNYHGGDLKSVKPLTPRALDMDYKEVQTDFGLVKRNF